VRATAREHYEVRLRLVPLTLLAMLGAVAMGQEVRVQRPAGAYDVVSVKPNKTGSTHSGIDTEDATFSATNVTIRGLLVQAYRIRGGLISGLPGWAESARFDVKAKVVDPDAAVMKRLTPAQRRAMIEAIMIDRFRVKVHMESKLLPVYDLVVTKSGPKFKESAPPAADDSSGTYIHNNDLTATAVPMSSFAKSLSEQLNYTVIDKTGLTGRYDLHLRWSPEGTATSGLDAGQSSASDATEPSMFLALPEQLGLKLVPSKGPVETLIVDRVETPLED
jgi:uncharacterized protein (TIGR03435 family)